MYRIMIAGLVSVLLSCASPESDYDVDNATYTAEMYMGEWVSTGRYTKNTLERQIPEEAQFLLTITEGRVHFRDASDPEYGFECPWEISPIPVISRYGVSQSISAELRGLYCPVFPDAPTPPYLYLAWYNDSGDSLEMEFVRK